MINKAELGMRVVIIDPTCCYDDVRNDGKSGTIVEIDNQVSFLVAIDNSPEKYWRCRNCVSLLIDQPDTCKGIWYRISVDQFNSHRGFSAKVRARLLKSESCPGCPECEEIYRRIALIGNGAWIDNLQEKQHGDKCRLKIRSVNYGVVYKQTGY